AGTVSGGVVAGGTGANNGSAFGSGFFLHGNGALVFNPGTSETRTISDVIADQTGNGGTGANAGSWSITKNGAGTLVLGAANTFSGGATLNAGSLRLLNNTSAGTGAITANGSVISYGNGVTLSNPVTLNSNTTQVEVLGTDSATQSGVISETGGARPLEKIGTGTLTLNAANTYTGTTNVSAGTLRLGAAGSLASGSNLTLANGATFDLNGRTQSFGAVNGAAGSFLTLGAGALTLGAGNATSSVASVISGTGTLTKTGTGTLTLSGNNNYSGGTVISGGRVILNNIAGLGTGTAGFSGGSLHSNVSGTLANNLSLGSGSDTRLSASTGQTVTLTGALNWGGGGTSTLRFGSPSDQGTFVWTIPSGTLTDPVGTTRIIAVEGGTLRAGNGVLSAATAFQNMTTRIDAGATLDFNGIGSTIRNLQGAGTLTNSVNTFIQSGNFSGTITGAGSISTNFLTTLILSGNNTYTGTTTISGATTRLEIGAGGTTGTLGTGNVINNGQLVFNRSNTYEVANVISGTGSLTQNGTGTLNLSGNSTYTGATLVNAGTLRVNGSIGSSSGVTVAAGASLGGNGTLPSLTINGTLAPGNSIGTVTVNGNLTLGAGSTTEIEVEGSTADRINVTGTANLSGNLRLVGLGGAYRFNAPYTILQAGSRVGTFNTTTTVGNFGIGVVPSISYIGARVDLTLTPAVLTTVLGGGTPGAPVASATPLNPASVANAIDRAVRAGTDVGAFFPIFNQSSVGALTEALGQVSGEVHSALPALAFEATTRFHSAMQDPHVAGRDGKPSAPRGSGPGQIGRRHYRLWASADGIYGVAHGNASIGSQRRNDRYGGFHAGVDLDLTPQIIAGLALGFGHGHAHLAHGYGRMDTGFIHLGTHVAASFGAFSLRASAAHSWTESRTSRHIPVFGASATAKYKASIWSGRVEGAYALLDHAGVTVAPFLALAASSTRNDRFLENSVINAISVIGGQTNRNSVRAEAGLQIAYRTTLSGMSLSFDTRLAYAHSLAHEIRSTHTLAGLSGQTFTIRGAKPDRAAALLSAGATLALSDRTTLSLRAGAELARKAAAGSASAKLNIHF
ncbi:MAG: autotransporter domain-containing protein, partial [Rhizobiales bacterium]|nr:autotransporter domain-containing protein [Hyphomicrobiales bacterium]